MKTILPLSALAFSLAATSMVSAGPDNDTLNVELTGEVDTLNYYFNSSREGLIASLQIYDTLLSKDFDTGEFSGNLASAWSWIDDTTLEFTLRDDVTFHNGETFNADDVVFTLNYVSDPSNSVVIYDKVSWIDRAEKVDDLTVRVTLDAPFPAALDFFSLAIPMYPDEYYATAGKDGMGTAPVGTGPYSVVSVEPGSRYTLEANSNYFDGPKGQPNIGTVVVRTVSDRNTQIADLMTGKADFLWQLPADLEERLRQTGDFTVLSVETMRIGFVTLDAAGRSGDTPLKNRLVRQAINHAVDREAIVATLVKGGSSVNNTPCSPIQFGCITDVPTYAYDPDRARDLLTEAGYPDGFEISMTGYRDRPLAEAIVNFLAEVGIKVNYESLQYSALAANHMDGAVPMAFLTHGSSSIPDMSAVTPEFFGLGKQDYAGDEEVARLITVGNTSIDPDIRRDNYTQALNRIAEEAYWLPLWTYSMAFAFTPELDYAPTPDELVRFYDMSWKQ